MQSSPGAATSGRLEWVRRGADYYSTADGRFDLLKSAYGDYWLAIDADFGKKFTGTREACEAWAQRRAGGTGVQR